MPRAGFFLLLVLISAAPAIAAGDEYRIKLAYFVPNDRTPTPNHVEKIRSIMSFVSDLYLSDLNAKGHKTDGLRFEVGTNIKAEPVVHLIRGDKAASFYNNAPRYDANEQWRRVAPEIKRKLADPQKHVIVVFLETYDDGPSERFWPGIIARGGYNNASGGLAMFSAHLLKNEFAATTPQALRKLFFDQTPVPGRANWGHKAPAPRGSFVEDGVGAVAHELGHALGLPHDRRQDDIDVMGNGFRNLRWNLSPNGGPGGKKAGFCEECTLLLMSSRYLNDALNLADTAPPKLEATAQRAGSGWTIKVKASDNTSLRSIIFFDRTSGSILDGRALSGKSVDFTHRLESVKSADPKFQLILTDNGGHQTRLAVD